MSDYEPAVLYIRILPHRGRATLNFGELHKGEVRRIPLPRISVNQGKKN
jgi:hypothetical protein